jgi:hypothetical protein
MEIPVAIANNRMRMEMDLSSQMKSDAKSPLSRMIMIDRRDKKAGYTLYPDTQRYLVHPEKEQSEERPRVEKTRVGSEVIGKHATDKYKVRIIYKDGRIEEGFIWNAKDLGGLTIKSETENKNFKTSTELRDIVLKTPDPSLFEIPAGYTEARGFMDVMERVSENTYY